MERGLFTREIEEDMLSGKIDIAVHSMKDMPVLQPVGLLLDTYLPREDVRDAFVSNSFEGISDLPAGTLVGTSSLRRKAQLQNKRPRTHRSGISRQCSNTPEKARRWGGKLHISGNGGANRLDMTHVAKSAVAVEDMLPAVAQGAIGIERRENDLNTAGLLEAIHDIPTGQRLSAERAFLKELDGSCETPIAGLAELQGGQVHLRGEVLRPDGSEAINDHATAPIEDAAILGRELAKKLLSEAGEGFFDWRE